MKKKILLATASLLSVIALGACSGGNQDIATMKGGKITVEDFYNKAKKDQNNQQTVRNMVIYKVFNQAYGDKVTEKQIDEEYKKTEKQLGSSFESQLQAAGYTKKTYRESIKEAQAFQVGLRAHVKLTDADMKAAWNNFHPEVSAQIILASNEDEAKAIKKQLDEGADFTQVAKEKSQDTATKKDGGKIKFDSQSQTPPAAVKEAAFKLKDGETSGVVSAMDPSTYQTSFYIVKMEKNQSKGNDMKKYEKELKKAAEETKVADQAFTRKVIADELKKANVKVKDNTFDNVLAEFLKKDDKKTTDSSSKKKTSSSSKTESSSSSASSSEQPQQPSESSSEEPAPTPAEPAEQAE